MSRGMPHSRWDPMRRPGRARARTRARRARAQHAARQLTGAGGVVEPAWVSAPSSMWAGRGSGSFSALGRVDGDARIELVRRAEQRATRRRRPARERGQRLRVPAGALAAGASPTTSSSSCLPSTPKTVYPAFSTPESASGAHGDCLRCSNSYGAGGSIWRAGGRRVEQTAGAQYLDGCAAFPGPGGRERAERVAERLRLSGCGVAGAAELVELLALLGDGVAQLREFGAFGVREAGVPVPFAWPLGQQRGGPPRRAWPGERGAKVVSGDERLAVAIGHGVAFAARAGSPAVSEPPAWRPAAPRWHRDAHPTMTAPPARTDQVLRGL